MLKVTIYNNEKNECVGFTARDHAGFAESGQDIVCASASLLIINTVNAIDQFTEDDYSFDSDEKTGFLDYRIKGNPSKEAELLLKTMVQGLLGIEEDSEYAQYIDIIFEEV